MANFDNRIMKELCVNSLRRILKNMRVATVDELAETTNIERDTAAGIIEELCRSGEFEQSGKTCRFNEKYRLTLVVCMLEINRVFVAVSDLYGEYLEKEEIAASSNTIDFFDRLVQKYRDKYPSIGLLVFGVAGFENRKTGHLFAMDFPQLEGYFREHFTKEFGLPVIQENDINAAVLGFYETRNFGEEKSVCALYFPQSHHPGGALCINGSIFRGRDNMTGEISFLKTAIQWKHSEKKFIDYSTIDVPALICDLALPAIAWFNPDCLVVYGDWLQENTARELETRLKEIMPREFIPDIVFVPDILQNFLDGLIRLALKELEPKIDFNDNEE
ncbi:MAG: ROK family protein [Treponema sp.]|jgi:predicted NBD/HSP70 family sugar kinase|nr:ROK family protein [Treponema sp.]